MQDDAAQYLYFVQSGFVRLSYLMEDGSTVLHSVLPSGESFGELGIFEGGTYPEMATAVGLLQATCVSISAFRALCRDHPPLSDALSQAIAKRYRSYILLTRDLSLKTLAGRLAQAVLRLADGLSLKASHGGRAYPCIGAMLNQTDLSLMARGSRGNVNRALKRWERQGWILLRDRSILVLDRKALERVAIEEGL